MKPKQRLVTFLDEILQKEQNESREVLAGYIVGELIGDYDSVYETLQAEDSKVARIADLASDLEWSNGSEWQLEAMWSELKILAGELRDQRQ